MEHGFLCAGEWVSAGERLEIRSPYQQLPVGSTWQADRKHVEAALAAAQAAFEVTRAIPAYERQAILRQVSEGIQARKEEFAKVICLEAGKPIKASRAEVARAIFTFQLAAEESTRIYGEYLPMDLLMSGAGRHGIVRRFPIGVIAAITPFNFPLNLVAHKLAPAMAAGCAVILKPAPQTPFSALMLAKLIADAGWPKGALNVMPMSNDEAAVLVESEIPRMLTFTGSAKVGWELKARAGKKRVTLELGGNAGVIVHSDADIEDAATRCAIGGFTYSGQSCISVQRIRVEKSVFEKFKSALVEKVEALKVGDPRDGATDVGPLIRESDAARVEQWIAEAVKQGAKLLCSGKRDGLFISPAVLTETKPHQRVNCEEIFAPVVTMEAYDDFDEALREINSTPYGLQAGVFTNDARLQWKAFEELNVGGVMINEAPTFRMDHMPYGGVKDSGLGREGVRSAIAEMTEEKVMVVR